MSSCCGFQQSAYQFYTGHSKKRDKYIYSNWHNKRRLMDAWRLLLLAQRTQRLKISLLSAVYYSSPAANHRIITLAISTITVAILASMLLKWS